MKILDPEAEDRCVLAFHLRKKSGLSQANFAQTVGLSLTTIRRYESGRRSPSRRMLERLARASGVSLAKAEESAGPELQRSPAAPRPANRLPGRGSASPPGPGPWSSDWFSTLLSGIGKEDPPEPSLGEVGSEDPWLAAGPPEAPGLSWGTYIRLWKATLHHALGEDYEAAAELSIAHVMAAEDFAPGPRFVFYLLKVAYLLAAGEAQVASLFVGGLAAAATRLPPPGEELRVRWTAERARSALGERESAERALAGLQAEFAAAGLALETICIWADRAALDLESGRSSAPVERLEELSWARQDPSLNPKMVSAFEAFFSLLERGEATPRVARRLVAYLLGTQVHDGGPFVPVPEGRKARRRRAKGDT